VRHYLFQTPAVLELGPVRQRTAPVNVIDEHVVRVTPVHCCLTKMSVLPFPARCFSDGQTILTSAIPLEE
jgi:hypothetical protein